MITLLSPAKALNFEGKALTSNATQPLFQKETEILVKKLKSLSPKQLGELMSLSSNLADLNYERYQKFSSEFTKKNAKQALFTFAGEVYKGLDAESLSQEDITFAQENIRILSGLYGVLRPLDLMQPYRLEMGTKLKVRPKQDNLYKFWGDSITNCLNEETQGKPIINLASNEYFKSVKPKKLNSEVITPTFKDFKNGTYKTIMVYAKHARGAMARYIVQNKLQDSEKLKAYNVDGYSFDEKLSEGNNWVFVR